MLFQPRFAPSHQPLDPPVRVGFLPALDRHQAVAQALGELAGAAAADGEFAVAPGDLAHRGDHRSGAARERLDQMAGLRIGAPLVEAVALFAHGQAFFGGEQQQAVASDAGQDRTTQRGG